MSRKVCENCGNKTSGVEIASMFAGKVLCLTCWNLVYAFEWGMLKTRNANKKSFRRKGNELEKHSKTFETRRIIEEFLDFLNNKNIELATWGEVSGVDRLFPIGKNRQELLNIYFNINAIKLEKERRALLEKATKQETKKGQKNE